MTALSHSKKCLFGGTILAAGLIGQTAPAQTLNWIVTQGTAYGQGATSDSYAGTGAFSVGTVSYSGGMANASATATYIGADTSFTYGNGYMAGRALGEFTVTSDGTATLSWDFNSDPVNRATFVQLLDLTNGDTLLHEREGTAGSQDFLFTVGTEYRFYTLSVSSGTTGSSFAGLTIPAPGSAALLGIAGLIGVRRRRE